MDADIVLDDGAAAAPVVEEIDIDDDPIMSTQELNISSQRTQDLQEIDAPLREEAINIRGVNEMSNKDVKSYVQGTCSVSSVFNIDWVDDSSVNIVFVDVDAARSALQAMTDPSLFYDGDAIEPRQPRAAKTYVKPDHGKVALEVRCSYITDTKDRDARQKSKYYLYHGEPTRIEDFRRFEEKTHTEELLERRRNLKPSGRSDITGDDLFPSISQREEEEDLISLSSSRDTASRRRHPRRDHDGPGDGGRWQKDPSLIDKIERGRQERYENDLFSDGWGSGDRRDRSMSPVSRMRDTNHKIKGSRERSTSPWERDVMEVDDDISTRLDPPREMRRDRRAEDRKRVERRRGGRDRDSDRDREDWNRDRDSDNNDLASRFAPRKGGGGGGGGSKGRKREHELFG